MPLPQQVLDYKADYTFTLNKKDGYAYTVKVAIGGQEITCTVNEAGTEYTIPGDKILGDTVVTVTRTKEASQITFTGSTDDLVGEVSRSAPVGQDFTFTLTKDADYEYTVSAKYTESGETVPVTDNGNGTYTIEVGFEGGSGKSHVLTPCTLKVENGAATATIVWSSPNYDYMIVDGEKYLPTNTEGNSNFEIPVAALDTALAVTADTVAMSTPHEIDYTLTFDSATLTPAE